MSEKNIEESGVGKAWKSGVGIPAELYFSADWQEEADAEVAEAKAPKQDGRRKVTLRLSCSRREDKVARFYDCGKPGDDLFERASRLLSPTASDDKSSIEAFIEKNFEKPNVEILLLPLQDGYASVRVADADGDELFADDKFDAVSPWSFIRCDPRSWQYDESMGASLTERLKACVAAHTKEIEAAFAAWEKSHPGEPLGESFGKEFLRDFADSIARVLVQSPFVEAGIEMANPDIPSKAKASERLMAVMCADSGGADCLVGEITLEDGEDFDPRKLRMISSAYSWCYWDPTDSVLPVVLYGDKFYRLSRDSWKNQCDYGFVLKEEDDDEFAWYFPVES